ncbi:MAG: nucleotide exchange factor GrpE [Candidatus Omnitrophica bacterium]|nr:nucleotide exchange factor GrpE [Candidatus Omnitrophota bacterium]MCM8808801.1 nucleotide exchange factor GrpE [Candidatus Omnitrophota bacterium]MCM8810968.1 nucleotide exchange factor GrpE [Candidatus Omnitrophota bacterium]MCM8832865.1 nucleotide exchange factor GrpE [Candidatus Omnitrophota bacterium]
MKKKIFFVKEDDLKNLREIAKKFKEIVKEKEKLDKKIEELNDKYLRTLAEFDNYRKRIEKEKMDLIKYGNENLILQLIPFDEIFENVIKMIEQNPSPEVIKKGLELLKKEFEKFLESHGVKRIKAKGEKFNPNLHEAVGVIEMDGIEDGIILEEDKSGYIYKDKVIRPSMVRVAKSKSKDNVEDKSTSKN